MWTSVPFCPSFEPEISGIMSDLREALRKACMSDLREALRKACMETSQYQLDDAKKYVRNELEPEELHHFIDDTVPSITDLGDFLNVRRQREELYTGMQRIVSEHHNKMAEKHYNIFRKYLTTDEDLTDDEWKILVVTSEHVFGVRWMTVVGEGEIIFSNGSHVQFRKYRQQAKDSYLDLGFYLGSPIKPAPVKLSTMDAIRINLRTACTSWAESIIEKTMKYVKRKLNRYDRDHFVRVTCTRIQELSKFLDAKAEQPHLKDDVEAIVLEYHWDQAERYYNLLRKYLTTDEELTDGEWNTLPAISEEIFGERYMQSSTGSIRFGNRDEDNFRNHRKLAQDNYCERDLYLGSPIELRL